MTNKEIKQLEILWERGIYPLIIRLERENSIYYMNKIKKTKIGKYKRIELSYIGMKNQIITINKKDLKKIKDVYKFND